MENNKTFPAAERSRSFKIKVKASPGLQQNLPGHHLSFTSVNPFPETYQMNDNNATTHSIEITRNQHNNNNNNNHNQNNKQHNIQRRHTQRHSRVSSKNPIVSARRIKSVRYASRPGVGKNVNNNFQRTTSNSMVPSPVLVSRPTVLIEQHTTTLPTAKNDIQNSPTRISKTQSFNNRNGRVNRQVARTNTISFMPDKLSRINEDSTERSHKKRYSRVIRQDSYLHSSTKINPHLKNKNLKTFHDVYENQNTDNNNNNLQARSQESSPQLSTTDSRIPILPNESSSNSDETTSISETTSSELDANSCKGLSRNKNYGKSNINITTIAANPANRKNHQVYRNLTFNGKTNCHDHSSSYLPRAKKAHASHSVKIKGYMDYNHHNHNLYGDTSVISTSQNNNSKLNYFNIFEKKKTGNVESIQPENLTETGANSILQNSEKATTLNTQDITNIINKFSGLENMISGEKDYNHKLEDSNNDNNNNNKNENLKQLKMTEKQLEKKLEDLNDEPTISRIQKIKYIILMMIIFVLISLAVFGAIVYLKRVFDNRKMATDVQDSNFVDFFNTDKRADFH